MAMKLIAKPQSIAKAKETTHVYGVFQSAPDKPLPSPLLKAHETAIQRLAAAKIFSGAASSKYFLRAQDDSSPNLLFIGLGEAGSATPEDLRGAGARAYAALNGEKVAAAALAADTFFPPKPKKGHYANAYFLPFAVGF